MASAKHAATGSPTIDHWAKRAREVARVQQWLRIHRRSLEHARGFGLVQLEQGVLDGSGWRTVLVHGSICSKRATSTTPPTLIL